MVRRGDSRALEVLQQQRQRAVENHRWIAVRHGVTEKVLHASELVITLTTYSELYFVAFRRERLDLGAPRLARIASLRIFDRCDQCFADRRFADRRVALVTARSLLGQRCC
jgi:hypothetical protein